MGRHKNNICAHFLKCQPDCSFKSARAKYKHCDSTISATPVNMRTHYGNCEKVPRSIGRLPSDSQTSSHFSSLSVRSRISKSSKASIYTNLKHMVTQSLTTEMKNELELKFSKAMHATATQFSFFDHPSGSNSFLHYQNGNFRLQRMLEVHYLIMFTMTL